MFRKWQDFHGSLAVELFEKGTSSEGKFFDRSKF